MANPNYPNEPGYRDPDPVDPRNPRTVRSDTAPAFLPTWGWVALVIAAIVVFSLLFSWGDGTQQQAEIPNTPPAVSTTPPASSPATPPAQSPANPPAETPSNTPTTPAPSNQ